jgi:PadR family transcriptional regulator, regulatory protein PadR
MLNAISMTYISMKHIGPTKEALNRMHARELKKGSAELLILSLVESRARHGYEIGKLIEQRSDGAITFSAAALYPLLYRLEKRGWIQGHWVERAGQRRRRYYKLTAAGRQVLGDQRSAWRAFAAAINRIAATEET